MYTVIKLTVQKWSYDSESTTVLKLKIGMDWQYNIK